MANPPPSILTTRTLADGGGFVRESTQLTTPLHVDTISQNRSMAITSAQRHYGVEHHPIRLSEQTLEFQVTHATRERRDVLSSRIRAHHRYCIEGYLDGLPVPMVLYVPQLQQTFRGFIKSVPDGDTRFLAAYVVQYSMTLVTDLAHASQGPPSTEPYVPAVSMASEFSNEEWMSLAPPPSSMGQVVNGWIDGFDTGVGL